MGSLARVARRRGRGVSGGGRHVTKVDGTGPPTGDLSRRETATG